MKKEISFISKIKITFLEAKDFEIYYLGRIVPLET